jgi:CHAT domain-containing protein
VVVCVVGAVIALRQPVRDLRLELALHEAISVVNGHRELVGAPLVSDASPFLRSIALIIHGASNRFEAASQLLNLAKDDGTDRGKYAQGVAHLVGGKPEEAVARFNSIAPERRDATIWTNLAVAEEVAGAKAHDHDRLLGALAATDHALLIDSASAEAWFVRALTFEGIGLSSAAAASWRPGLAACSSSPWKVVARSHLMALTKQVDDATAWKGATAHIETLSPGALAALARTYPQQARTYGESIYASAWADAIAARRYDRATAELRLLHVIAESLRLSTGESLLFDVVRCIDDDAGRRPLHAQAFFFYRSGRLALRDHDPNKAMPDLIQARLLFASVSNPMALLTECYIAIALVDQNRAPEARRRLLALVAAERAARSRHDALIALALYHVALCDTAEGNWSDALVAAEESLSIFSRLGERGLAGTVESLVSESYDFLGQQELAWQHGRAAIALLIASGERYRARIVAAGLSHAELRHGRWDFAKALVRAERLMANDGPMPWLDCDMLLRLATAEYHLGDHEHSTLALAEARASALRVSDASIRMKLRADVDAVTGSLLRHVRPRGALSFLSAAIGFQERAEREVLLPQLYLERGRAYAAIGDRDNAEWDFERGIERLERQRTRMTDAEVRSGIFDDASDLFHEVVSLELLRNDAGAAFRSVERGRARAMLEEMASKDAISPVLPPAVAIEALRDALPPDRLLVEYQLLENQLAIFTLDRAGLVVTRVAVREAVIERTVRTFVDALVARRSMTEIEPAATRLFSWLAAPIGDRLSRARSVVIVPDATLQQLPFAALINPNTGKFFIEEHVLMGAPSAAVYAVSERRAARSIERAQPTSAVVFANPLLQGGAFESLAALPASEREGFRVGRLYPQTLLINGAAATPSRFTSVAPSCDVLHFAGHAIIRPREPWHSALLLSPIDGDGGLLSVSRISRMSLPRTQIVVLASCGTLKGHTAGVEGVPSIARAFLIAGVPAVIGTLWDIEDGEAGALVEILHDRLARGSPPAEALRFAQLEALRNTVSETSHPGYWSVFALLGASMDSTREHTNTPTDTR